MTEKMKNVWNWIKEHKVELATTALVAVGGAVLWKCHIHKKAVLNGLSELPSVVNPTTELVTGISDFDGHLLQVNDSYALSELGKLGEQIREFAPDISEDIFIWGLLDHDKVET